MNELQVFKNNEFGQVRTINVENESYFVGKDVAIALGYSNASKAVSNHVDNEDKKFIMLDIADAQNGNVLSARQVTDSLGRRQQAKFINESNLYRLIAHSKLPSKEKFERGV